MEGRGVASIVDVRSGKRTERSVANFMVVWEDLVYLDFWKGRNEVFLSVSVSVSQLD